MCGGLVVRQNSTNSFKQYHTIQQLRERSVVANQKHQQKTLQLWEDEK